MTTCKECLHLAVCGRYTATGGNVRECKHFVTGTNVGSEWIPVTERLPRHGEVILCRLRFNELRILQWDNISKWWLGYGAGDDWQQRDVTHWMPLPEPPKGE